MGRVNFKIFALLTELRCTNLVVRDSYVLLIVSHLHKSCQMGAQYLEDSYRVVKPSQFKCRVSLNYAFFVTTISKK